MFLDNLYLIVMGIIAILYVAYDCIARFIDPKYVLKIKEEIRFNIILVTIGLLMITMFFFTSEITTETKRLSGKIYIDNESTSQIREAIKEAIIRINPNAYIFTKFPSSDSGVRYQARRLKESNTIYHEAISPPINNRILSTVDHFKEAANFTAHKPGAIYYYIANFEDTVRRNRIEYIGADPRPRANFQFESLDPGSMANYMMNFMVFDDSDEVVLAIPESDGKSTIISIHDTETKQAFSRIFLKQWGIGKNTINIKTW